MIQMILSIKLLRTFNETLISELCNSGILVLSNKDKIPELHNSEILFSLKIPSYEKSAKD